MDSLANRKNYSQELHYEKKKNNDFFAYMPKNHYLCTQIALKGLFNPSQPKKQRKF